MVYTVALGGSFDNFHIGHESLLRKAFEVGDKIIIGVCTEGMVREKKRGYHLMGSFDFRKGSIERFVKRFSKPYEIIHLNDSFGPVITDENIDAIVATPKTAATCEQVNSIRKTKGLRPMKIFTIKMIYSDDCRYISSTRIRFGEIDKEGKILVDYAMTNEVRELLKEPWGELIEGSDETGVAKRVLERVGNRNIISIGDVVTGSLLRAGYKPRNAIVDGKVKREVISSKTVLQQYRNNFSIRNPSGRISKESWGKLKDALRYESAIYIDGEEDIMVTPVGLLAEHNTVILYGMPDRGVVLMEVNIEMKNKLRGLLGKFRTTR